MTDETGKNRMAVLASASFLLFGLAGLALNEITRINVRFALMVEDMAKHGIGIFPTINAIPYPDYPSPMVILSYFTTCCGRFVSLPLLTLPSLIFGSLTLFLTWKLGEKRRPGAGIYALFALCCTWEFINQLFVGIGMDVPEMVAGIAMLSLLARDDKKRAAMIAFPFLLVFTFVFRGPFGLFLLGGGVAGYLLFSGRFREILPYGLLGGLTTVLCALAGYYAILLQGGTSLWNDTLDWQVLSRMSGDNEFFYFFTCAIGSFAPVTILGVLALILHPRRIGTSPSSRGIVGFAFAILLMLSIPSCKHLRYMAIALPAFALLSGEGIASLDDSMRRKGFGFLAFATFTVLFIAGIALMIIGFVAFGKNAPFIHFALFVICITLLALQFFRCPDEARRVPLVAMLLLGFYYLVLFPFSIRFEHFRDFVASAEKLRGERTLIIYRIGPDHLDNYYILHLDPAQRDNVMRIYADDSTLDSSTLIGKMYPTISLNDAGNSFFRSPEGGFVLLEEKRLAEFLDSARSRNWHCETLMQGRLGRKSVVILEVKSRPVTENERP